MLPRSRSDAEAALQAMGRQPVGRLDLTAAALICSVHEAPDQPSGPALDILEALTGAALDSAPQTAAQLAELLFGRFGFAGDTQDYDSPLNADLRHVLVRRRGLPVALGVVWRHAARATGLPLSGTNMPGHFLVRLEQPGGPELIDVFQGGALVDEAALQRLARQAGEAGVTPQMIAPVPDLVIAVRLQTNLASRARVGGDVEAWERAALRRALLCPRDARLHLDHAEAALACGMLARARSAAGQAAQAATTAEHQQAARRLLDRTARTLN